MCKNNKSGKISKGMPSAVVLSILIHAALFLLAGILVVFTVVKKEEKKFTPPKAVERPKMKLRKPKVKVKKTAKPKPTTRIVTKMNRASMPDIQLPEMSGMGQGLGEMAGGFDMMPDLDEVTVFGGGQSIGNDLVGTFYDLKRDRKGRPIPYSQEAFLAAIRKFVKKEFTPSQLAKYYRSSKKLYATFIMMPPMLSSMAPMAFGENDTGGYLFLIHYEGELVHRDGITFRFRGSSGDGLLVGLDGEVVLNGCWIGWEHRYQSDWRSMGGADNRKHMLGFQPAAVSEWITLEPGVPRRLDILVAETPGGGFSAQLVVEEQGVEYERNGRGGSILPMFKTAEPTLDQMDSIYYYLVDEGEVCLTNGPVFSDYNTTVEPGTKEADPESDQVELAGSVPEEPMDKMRLWTPSTGQTFEAEFIVMIGDKAVFRDARGKQRKIPLVQLSEEDRLFMELNSPPEFDFSFSKQSDQRPFIDPGPYIAWISPTLIDYVFTANLKQVSAGSYNHELQVEFFAVGEEVDGDNYILLDRQTSAFSPAQKNNRALSFSGNPVLCYAYDNFYKDRRGTKYGGYLITVTDSRGKIIDYKTSHKWLFENIEALKKLPTGKHFNKTCTRVFPPRPKGTY